jgi:hypothetical protein
MHKIRRSSPNPRRVAAGRKNRLRRGPLTDEGRQLLRLTALRNKPWRFSTGPRTAAGKASSSANGRWRQKSKQSQRQLRAAVADVWAMLAEMRDCRRLVGG